MNTTHESYRLAAEPLTTVLDAVPDGAWSRPSPCEDWTARDVVGHLVETQRSLLAEHGVGIGDVPDVAADPAAAWREHAARVMDVLRDGAVPSIAFDGFFGPTTLGETLVQFYVWDMVVHRWDVATAVGGDTSFTPSELDQVERGIDGFGDALYTEGICRAGVEAPPDADRRAQLLARLGRPVDFEARDEEPVDLVILVLWPEAAPEGFLPTLSDTCRSLRDEQVRRKLRMARAPEEVLALLSGPPAGVAT